MPRSNYWRLRVCASWPPTTIQSFLLLLLLLLLRRFLAPSLLLYLPTWILDRKQFYGPRLLISLAAAL